MTENTYQMIPVHYPIILVQVSLILAMIFAIRTVPFLLLDYYDNYSDDRFRFYLKEHENSLDHLGSSLDGNIFFV